MWVKAASLLTTGPSLGSLEVATKDGMRSLTATHTKLMDLIVLTVCVLSLVGYNHVSLVLSLVSQCLISLSILIWKVGYLLFFFLCSMGINLIKCLKNEGTKLCKPCYLKTKGSFTKWALVFLVPFTVPAEYNNRPSLSNRKEEKRTSPGTDSDTEDRS